MTRRAFNWSELDRTMLYSMLYELKPKIVDKRLPIAEITSIISKHIKALLPIKVTSNRYKPVKPGEVWIGGAYHSYLDNLGNKRFIEVELSFPTTADSMKTSLYRWERMCRLFADTVLHEIIHMRQFRRRNFNKLRVKQLYYGTLLTSIQQVVDFLLGYQEYLKSVGFRKRSIIWGSCTSAYANTFG